jgi:predicted phage-related endonuclease
MQTGKQLSLDYQSFKERLYTINSNLEIFCQTIGIAAITAKKWKSSGVPYRYVLLLEYMEMVDDMNRKYKYYTNKLITKEIKRGRKISA